MRIYNIPVLVHVGGCKKALLQFLLLMALRSSAAMVDDYVKQRDSVLKLEEDGFRSGAMNLTAEEELVNTYLVQIKFDELNASYTNFSAFLPAENFLKARHDIENSKVFQFIKKVPKGASLHTHMLAGVSTDYVIQDISYMDNVYACYNNLGVFKLKFLQDAEEDTNCTWKSLKNYREEFEAKNQDFDIFLKNELTLNKDDILQNRNDLWKKFKNTFSSLYDLVAYRPIFKQYIFQLLKELYQDNIIYTELRCTFLQLYDLNGTTYDTKFFLDTFLETIAEFKKCHNDFIGVKYIFSFYRGIDNETLKAGLDQLIYYQSLYPDFILGFDFVGIEEEGRKLIDFHEELVGVANDLKFFFHAGETNQFGNTDLNLADAILLNSSRIGHGFALPKHPELMKMAKKKNIAVELCPISNQVLKLIDDPRNHPASILLSKGCPVVICNDDPSAWDASGLSYDWYVVFMSMTWEDQGLATLKKFAEDSITYSAMSAGEKIKAFEVWERQWKQFISNIINEMKL